MRERQGQQVTNLCFTCCYPERAQPIYNAGKLTQVSSQTGQSLIALETRAWIEKGKNARGTEGDKLMFSRTDLLHQV